ncbi:MAG: translocation/assembly module TamB domain-containing protein [Pyrinomonadaceae bacterium]
MAEQDEVQSAEIDESSEAERAVFTRRRILFAGAAVSILLILVALLSVVSYRYGVFDDYIKDQFVAKMADIGIVFDADVFRVTVAPLRLELKNATFKDKLTGEKLFFIRDADLELSVTNLYAWQLSRDIAIDKTTVSGAEVWVKFDENGNSNFANLKLVEDERGSAVNFKYDTTDFTLRDSVVHFGDLSRRISADAKNIVFLLSPENRSVAEGERRYKFDFSSTESSFTYDERVVEKIDIRANGIADKMGAELTGLELKTPFGETTLAGKLVDWAAPRYDFDIQSSVDLTQATTILPLGTAIVGVGNFSGKVTGEGENYKIVGEIDSQSLRAEGISLKGVNVNATVEGSGTTYDANGTAIAEMLTFDDFRIDFLKFAGNVRGTGTDFRWVGDLQAAAAKTPALSLGGLFLSDATAEFKDRAVTAQASRGRAQRFAIGDRVFADLAARNLRFSFNDSTVNLTAPGATARSLTTKEFSLQGVTSGALRVRDRNGRTDVGVSGLRAESATLKDSKLRNVTASEFRLTDLPNSTEIVARNLRADQLDNKGTRVTGIQSPEITVRDAGVETLIYADRLRVAKIDAGSAVLGTLNIAGVRLSIRKGRVEGRSNDIDAGNVALAKTRALPTGGQLQAVKVVRPVFVLEPSGRYRVTADMSVGGGAVGSISLGAASAKVQVENNRLQLDQLTAAVMDGSVNGNAVIGLDNRTQSRINADFINLDIAKLLALQTGRIVPVEGQTSGRADLSFTGTNFTNASGELNASITANAGTAARGFVPVNGQIAVRAVNGLFNIEQANLATEKSRLDASGRFDLRTEDSNLTLALKSTDAGEVDRLVRVLGISPAIEEQLDSLQIQAAGNLAFNGTVTGNLSDPIVSGRASLDSLSLRGREVGSISTDIAVTPAGTELTNGKLQDRAGGSAAFAVNIPTDGTNNIAIDATLTNINAGNLLAALPIDLPAQIADLNGQTSGTIKISGLPDNAQGEVNLAAQSGVIAGQAFDGLNVKAVFNGTLVNLERAEMRIGAGKFTAAGNFDRSTEAFNLDVGGTALPVGLLLAFLPAKDSLPVVTGELDFTAKAIGELDRPESFNVNFSGVSQNVTVNNNALGQVVFKGETVNQVLTADLTAMLGGNPQIINASLNFGSDTLPFTVATQFNQSPFAPFLAFIPQVKDMPISGTGTGRIEFSGNLSQIDATGKRVYSAANLSGRAEFSQLALQIQETPLVAAEPVLITFNTREINFERARFSGGGSNVTVSGIKALSDDASNSLAIDGRVNLNLLNLVDADTFFAGFADASIRLTGPNSTARLIGSANIVNGSVATFLGADSFRVDRLQARIIFSTNQVEVEQATGFLGGGRFSGSGGGVLNGLSIQRFRFGLDGKNVTVPLPKDFVTTGDAQLEITGIRATEASNLQLTISGRVAARRTLYSKDIDLASLVSGRRDATLSGGGSANPPRFDLVIEGRDALIVRNNIADLTASVSLALTGDANEPRISGRITASSGTILFRKDRYVVQRGVLEFPPDTAIDPIINLQAESEIAGYQVFVNLSGPLKDSELLTATVRSSPALPQADVVSLITTGNLTNSVGGIPTLAATGINTAAEILTDAIINNPARKATDRLFGLNVFEIDPLISGQQANPGARLTVGRQINNNLRVTYSTNLSQDQNQILALEYRVSNRLSFVAQYEQRSLSNVTRNRDNFSFEVRFRKRF